MLPPPPCSPTCNPQHPCPPSPTYPHTHTPTHPRPDCSCTSNHASPMALARPRASTPRPARQAHALPPPPPPSLCCHCCQFGLPGAFTMVCSTMHLPGFVQLADDFKRKVRAARELHSQPHTTRPHSQPHTHALLLRAAACCTGHRRRHMPVSERPPGHGCVAPVPQRECGGLVGVRHAPERRFARGCRRRTGALPAVFAALPLQSAFPSPTHTHTHARTPSHRSQRRSPSSPTGTRPCARRWT